jgi:hypothetical protein
MEDFSPDQSNPNATATKESRRRLRDAQRVGRTALQLECGMSIKQRVLLCGVSVMGIGLTSIIYAIPGIFKSDQTFAERREYFLTSPDKFGLIDPSIKMIREPGKDVRIASDDWDAYYEWLASPEGVKIDI